jgi:superfamily I DNA/RNA helicase
MLIYGGAGTGKTILAASHARYLAEEGFDVLLLCFNEPLGNRLKQEFADTDRITATHLHSFAVRAIRSAGMRVPASPPSTWWDQELPELVERSIGALDLKLSAIVIDEGQDFNPSWWVPLELLLDNPEDSPFYMFADTAQQLYQQGWSPPFERGSFELRINCRNTLPIASRVARAVGHEVRSLGVEGPPPKFVTARDEKAILEAVSRAARGFLDEGFRRDQIAALTTSAAMRESLVELQFSPRSADEALDDGIVVESVHRFKGLESDVVILVLSGAMANDPALAYVGMSRAKLLLTVVGGEATRKSLQWDEAAGGRS